MAASGRVGWLFGLEAGLLLRLPGAPFPYRRSGEAAP
jgi:hypothetical protein